MKNNIKEGKNKKRQNDNGYRKHKSYDNNEKRNYYENDENSYDDIFNIAAKSDVTSKEYLETIAECTKSSLIQINIGTKLSRAVAGVVDFLFQTFLHREGFVSKNKIDFLSMDHSSCITHAEECIGYVPKYSCQQGLKKTIEWCEKENLL